MYKIGNININVEQINGCHNFERLKSFYCNDENHNVQYQIIYQDQLPLKETDDYVYLSDQLIVEKTKYGYRYFHVWQGNVYAVIEEYQEYYKIYLQKQCLEDEDSSNFIPSLFHLERPLLEADNIVLHSSSIEILDKAILFTAPSGGGKSTQADLWKKYNNSTILNGDKNIVGRVNGEWNVYGIPFSGSSIYCENKTKKLGAIIILEKSLENKITKLDLRGFQKVFSQITINPWNKYFCEKTMDLVMDLCCKVPVYLYACTKDETAMKFLYSQLKKDGVI